MSVPKNLVPSWLHIPFIETGYVTPGKTTTQCLSLLFKMHNQTINAWTMIIGAAISTALWWCTHRRGHLAFTVLWLSCVLHTPFSVAYHICRFTSEPQRLVWKNLDMMMISVSSILLTYALCSCAFPGWLTWTVVAVSLASAYVFLKRLSFTTDVFGHGEGVDKSKHVIHMLSSVVLYLVPVVYTMVRTSDLLIYCISCAIIMTLALTAIVYLSGFPERYHPVTFDVVGASHQWVHVGVVVAHVLEFFLVYHSIA